VVSRLTGTQIQRLRELGSTGDLGEMLFPDTHERDCAFKELERRFVTQGRQQLQDLSNNPHHNTVFRLEEILADILTKEGFVQVNTPILMSRSFLEKMTITMGSPLADRVFWTGKNQCLRPMLAPNLYYLLRRLVRLWGKPVRIFEIGPCFRRDSDGKHHLNEFTMLNLVELGLPMESRKNRLEYLITLIMKTVGIEEYQTIWQPCQVYGHSLDAIVKNVEICSAAMGPHVLDDAWGIVDPWVGIGLGLERLLMVKHNHSSIQQVGRSLMYLDGVRLNI
jgi:pyrrolysyl-tRNA synthetase-like protein